MKISLFLENITLKYLKIKTIGKCFKKLNYTHTRTYVCIQVCVLSCSIVSNSLETTIASRLLCPWNFPGKNTRMGCHSLHRGIFLIQGSNPSLLHGQPDSLPQSHLHSLKNYKMIKHKSCDWGNLSEGYTGILCIVSATFL